MRVCAALGWIAAAALASAAQAEIFPPPPERWQVLIDPPESPDDEERALGLLGSAARHYTHAHGAVSEVCTLEIWSFAAPLQAERVRQQVSEPASFAQRAEGERSPSGWWGRTAGTQLVLAHGVRLERGVGSRAEVSVACRTLAEAAHARALATLRAGGTPP